MDYSYDSFGWYSPTPIPGRVTQVPPPEQPWPEGQQPNWLGAAWQLMDYTPPPVFLDLPKAQDRRVTVLAFLSRFTTMERITIRTQAKTNIAVEDFMAMVNAATFIDLTRQDTKDGVGYLVQQGWLSVERAGAILDGPIARLERPESITSRQ